jgi:hypothetical protein
MKNKTKRKKVTSKPYFADPGLRERLDSINVSYRESFKDVMCNHEQNQQNPTIDVEWTFIEYNSKEYELHRIELDGTGSGMTEQIVNDQFFHTLRKEDLPNSLGEGIHSIGEKLFWAKMTKDNPKLRELGIEVLTKVKDIDEYYHIIYNPYLGENGIILQEYLTLEEAVKKELPADRIGSCGTWTKLYINTTSWNQNWFDELYIDICNYFSDKLRYRINITLILKNKNYPPISKKCKSFKIPCVTAPYFDVFTKSHFNYFGKQYKIKALLRPDTNSLEMSKFIKDYSEERALFGLETNFRDNLALIFVDENSGFWYHIRTANLSGRTVRGVIKIFVNKDDIVTDVSKNIAFLKKADGTISTKDTEHKKLFKLYDQLFPSNKVVEDDLRDQLINILRGVEWPVGFSKYAYFQLCDRYQIPRFNYDWARKNVDSNIPLLHKRLDIKIHESNHIVDLKDGIPDGDKDFNQIIAYSTLNPDTKKVTILANSKGKGFKKKPWPDVISKFKTQLNNNKTTKRIEWDVDDLSDYGLHILAEKYEDAPEE